MTETPCAPAAGTAGARPDTPPAGGGHVQHLTFTLGEETFAVGILAVREILEYGPVTPVPMTPGFIRGVINLRGAVVPVVDLAVRFGRAAQPPTRRTCIVIVELQADAGTLELGVVVDAVLEVLEIPAADIGPAPEFGARVRTDFIRGMGRVAGRFVTILDAQRVLSMEEVSVLGGLAA